MNNQIDSKSKIEKSTTPCPYCEEGYTTMQSGQKTLCHSCNGREIKGGWGRRAVNIPKEVYLKNENRIFQDD